MGHVAFLTTELAPGYVDDDHLAVPFLRDRGIEAEAVRWREPHDWLAFDLVVVRSTWDYHRQPGEFARTLEAIAAATRLENPLELQRWNLRKTYLRDLAAAGIPVVPTVWRDRLLPGHLPGLFRETGAGEMVLKPVIGSSGENAFRVTAAEWEAREPALLEAFGDRPLMAQPFLAEVLEVGESSVVWIDGAVSHGLRKRPRPGEFRSQEEHGGRVEPIAVEGALAAAAGRAAAALAERSPRTPLYGRVDFLPGPDGWLLGELELVEPSLYLRVDPGAPARFAAAIAARLDAAL